MRVRFLVAVAVALLATACAGSAESPSGPSAESTTLRVGALGNATDTFNPMTTQGFADYVALNHIYGNLVRLVDGKAELDLAESIEPNETADRWTVTLRPGLTFSDGSAITGEDVAYSLRTLADPETSPNYSQFYADLDVDRITATDERTVEVALHRPRADFVTTVMVFASFVMKADATDWQQPVSSGEYTLTDYSPGERIVVDVRDDLEGETPEIDTIEVLVINDPQARMNALQAGQIDFATRIDPVMARTIAQSDGLTVHQGGTGDSQVLGFEMNVTQEPFTDPSVREAMKLAIDREALVEATLLDLGEVANDLVGLGLPMYHDGLPQRERDLDRARELFEEAGVSELTIRASDTTPGLVDAAKLYAEQLGEAGVEVEIEEVDPASFFADFDVLLNTPLQTSYYINRDAPAFIGSFTGSFGYFNISGYDPDGYDDAVRAAQSVVDDADREAAFRELQEQQWTEGGMILWGYQPVIKGQLDRLDGVTLNQGVPQFSRATLE